MARAMQERRKLQRMKVFPNQITFCLKNQWQSVHVSEAKNLMP